MTSPDHSVLSSAGRRNQFWPWLATVATPGYQRPAVKDICVPLQDRCRVQMQTKLCEVWSFTITENCPIKALSLLWVSAHILALSHLGIYFDSMRKRCCFAKVRVQLYCRDTAAAPCKYTISHHTHHHRSSPPALLHTQSQIDKEYSVICNVVCVCAVQVGVIIIVTVHK